MHQQNLGFFTAGFDFFITSNWLYAQATSSRGPLVSLLSQMPPSLDNQLSIYPIHLKGKNNPRVKVMDNVNGDHISAAATVSLLNIANRLAPVNFISVQSISR